MIQEEKQLLLQDLCARLLYGVIADCVGERIKIKYVNPDSGMIYISNYTTATKWEAVEVIKPYLRPMSSMTEGEYEELKSISSYYGFAPYKYIGDWCPNYEMIDWLNAHHFDYRGLIEKGLAFEAPEDMYK